MNGGCDPILLPILDIKSLKSCIDWLVELTVLKLNAF
jgi:hypothetical protein